MAQLRVDYSGSFNLSSTWYVVEDSYENMEINSGPTTASKTITLEYALPADAKITSAKLYSTWSSPNTGFKTRTVNGVTPTSRENGYVDVEIDAAASSISATFKFKANGSTSQGTGSHSGATTVSNIYLLIEYTSSSTGGDSGGTTPLSGISCIYKCVNGELVAYNLYKCVDGKLVPYNLYKCVDGELIQY
ncbi:MAG: hypothetical protein IJ444_01945 [Kiritimatiellae bacterium]|nr:hypothetical protein [Kiritimatiellia bacterium]